MNIILSANWGLFSSSGFPPDELPEFSIQVTNLGSSQPHKAIVIPVI
jgi:hypothetical protein